ncbi:hypothetical protein H2201_004649 [Coniosporium apollinis]|uniref:Cwf19-like C-terminal domain-containing protein n=1 Tax=Coniosporium apollinis TaxID=61459 RepID=A0ABQ9NS03_9PEZI|nr:hypothetical protein H2201_004649 [Coniosporium apollinis]
MSSKIVVVGDVNGQFVDVFKKISALHAKNAFSFALIAGNLFSDPVTATDQDDENVKNLIEGKTDVPLPTYFALGTCGLPQRIIDRLQSSAGEVCPNLYFLGKRTTIKTSEGIKIVALGGSLDTNITAGISKDKYSPFYSEDDAKVLRGANSADILVTSQWPAAIRTGSKIEVDFLGRDPTSQQCIAELCSALKPRYHFSISSEAFYEREPFFHASSEVAPDTYPVTRFLSLASYGNARKQKWIYAFSIDPSAAPPIAITPGTTASPLSFVGKKRPAQPSQESSYRFSTDSSHHRRPHKRARAAPPTSGECFFCLSNPNLATHLITSIGTDAYLTTAKGPLSTSSTYDSLDFPSHILIIPLTHTPTLAAIRPDDDRRNVYNEMQRYRRALQSMLTVVGGSKLGAVTWEVSRAGGIHTHWQFLPVPIDLIRRGLVEAAFKVEAENERYPAFQKRDVGDGADEQSDFFRVLIWSPLGKASGESNESDELRMQGKETPLVLPLDASFRFDLQFGRRVLAKLLGLEKRAHWQDCGQTHEDEVADAEEFKKAFKPFDFSLEE